MGRILLDGTPLRGGVNPSCSALQLTPASGDQLRTEALNAPSAVLSQSKPDNTSTEANIGFAAQSHIDFVLFR
jgi:hypothetical protein